MLEELLKTSDVQQLFESYYNLINIPVAIIDLNANVLFSSCWRRICTQFHRVHSITCSRCIESDTQLAAQLQEGKNYAIYSCRNGLTDCASPIIIEGKHIANVFIGQFFINKPDEDWYLRQAEEFGFDLADYLAAVREVPIVEEKRIPVILDLLIRMTRVITNLSIDRKNAIESEQRHSIILNTIPQSVFWKDTKGRYLGCNASFARAAGLAAPNDIVGKTDFDLPWPAKEAEAYRADDLAVISANESRLHIEEPLQQADGSRIVIDTSKVPLVDAASAPYGVVGIYEDITERKNAEKALRASQALLSSIVNSTNDLLWSVNVPTFGLVAYNSAFIEYFRRGLGVQVAENMRPEELLPTAEMAERWNEIYRRALSEGSFTTEYHMRTSKRTLLLSVNLLRQDGAPAGVTVFAKDITERKQAEEKIRESEERFKLSMEATNDGLWDWNKETDEVYYSPACYRMLGYEVGTFPGTLKAWQDLLHPEDIEHTMQVNMDCVEGRRETFSVEYRLKAANGEWRWILGRGKSITRDKQGRSVRLVGTNTDITERKRMEETLRESEERYRKMFQDNHAVMLIVDPESTAIIDANPAACAYYGWSREDLLQKKIVEINTLAPDEILAEMNLALTEKRNYFEFTHRLSDGSIRNVELYSGPLDIGGKALLFSIVHDITQRKQAERKLELNAHRIQALLQLNQMTGATLKDITDFALEQAVQLTQSTIGYLAFLNDDESVMTMHSWSRSAMAECAIESKPIIYPVVTTGLWGEAVRQRRPVITNDYAAPNPFKKGYPQGHVVVKRHMNIPVFVDYRIVLVAGVGNKADDYDQNDVHELTLLMQGMWRLIERNKAEEALRESEYKYKSLIENIPDIIFTIDLEGKITFVSKRTKEILGYENTETLSRNIFNFIPQEDHKRAIESLQKGMKGEKVKHFQIPMIAKSGEKLFFECSFARIYEDGVLVGAQGTAVDITARKLAEEMMRESEERYRLLFEDAQDGIALADAETSRLVDCNPALCRMVDREKPQLVGQPQSILHPADDINDGRSLSFLIHAGDTSRALEDRLIARDGELIPVEIRASHIRIDNRDFLLGIFRDITERKQSLRLLQASLTGTVQALATVVESRDPYTAGHQRRVAVLATAIASEMNLSIDQIEGISMAAVIHDLGKIAVPAEILTKPTKLTKTEFALIQEHPLSGYSILKDIEFPWPIARIILEHHEKIDGSGYPNKLSGGSILLESKILTVADVVEAMASYRPYRPALGIDVALNEIEKNKGIFYDDAVSDACLSLFREKGFQLEGI